VVWSFEFTAFSMMFLSANMAAPPTIGFSAAKAVNAKDALSARAISERFMGFSPVEDQLHAVVRR
jgi:hypothetical protein